jgi:dTDP-4-dehydrorhamnose reductase
VKLLVVGASGQIARALARDDGVVALGRPTLDLEHVETFAPALDNVSPDAVAIVGAWTAVDRAESEPGAAMRVNAHGPGVLAVACKARGLPVLYVSSDYVFDGAKHSAYTETDPIGPRTAYGASKAEGERRVRAAQPRSAVVRTSWVFDAQGANFVRTMLRLAKQQPRVRVVADQTGAPSYAPHVADGLMSVARHLVDGRGEGLFHMTAAGACTWADFADAIFAGAKARGGPHASVERIATADYPTPAKRPANSALDSAKVARIHGVTLPHWRDGLDACLDAIAANGWPD